MQTQSLCVNCGQLYDQEGRYHGYYCIDCRLGRGEQRGGAG